MLHEGSSLTRRSHAPPTLEHGILTTALPGKSFCYILDIAPILFQIWAAQALWLWTYWWVLLVFFGLDGRPWARTFFSLWDFFQTHFSGCPSSFTGIQTLAHPGLPNVQSGETQRLSGQMLSEQNRQKQVRTSRLLQSFKDSFLVSCSQGWFPETFFYSCIILANIYWRFSISMDPTHIGDGDRKIKRYESFIGEHRSQHGSMWNCAPHNVICIQGQGKHLDELWDFWCRGHLKWLLSDWCLGHAWPPALYASLPWW